MTSYRVLSLPGLIALVPIDIGAHNPILITTTGLTVIVRRGSPDIFATLGTWQLTSPHSFHVLAL